MIETNRPATIVGIFPPVLFKSVTSNKHYVIYDGVWYEVPSNFTIQDAYVGWSRRGLKDPLPSINDIKNKTWEVQNSKGSGHYTVTLRDRSWSCTCAGFGFRRQCKHITIIQKSL